jgi:hypothetical protein
MKHSALIRIPSTQIQPPKTKERTLVVLNHFTVPEDFSKLIAVVRKVLADKTRVLSTLLNKVRENIAISVIRKCKIAINRKSEQASPFGHLRDFRSKPSV